MVKIIRIGFFILVLTSIFLIPAYAGTESSIALGQIKVHANVTVSFELE